MLVEQFFTEGIAHSSYLLGGEKTCAIVDPRRDVEIYEESASSLDLKITHVLLTHLHADFISGHMELVSRCGVKVYAPKKARCSFVHQAVGDGDEIEIGGLLIRTIETPGHTPEHVSYLVIEPSRGPEPVCVFCGDTLFVGDVGRPDLFPNQAEELAAHLYQSLRKKLLPLPDFCKVFPAHGAGSLYGRTIAIKRTSTIGYEQRTNPALQINGREDFIRFLITNMPPVPDHFRRLMYVNKEGPTLHSDLTTPKSLGPEEFHRLLHSPGTLAVDTRSYGAFGGYHIPGSYNIDLDGRFVPVLAGWVLPPEARLLLVSQTKEDINTVVHVLHRVGLDNITGYLEGGIVSWAKMGFPLEHTPALALPDTSA